ncbi:MAG: CpaD family pilus assembly lipoprotein [Geminicoccaceae bacterium]
MAATLPSLLRAAGLAAVLAGCTSLDPVPPPDAPKALEVAPVTALHTVWFDTDRDRPDAVEAGRLAAFVASLPPGDRQTVQLAGHADDRASDPYNLDLSARRARTVAALVAADGATDTAVTLTAYGERAPRAAGTDAASRQANRRVDIVVRSWTVRVPGCPDWSRDPAYNPLNQPMSNLGCATLSNLGRMVADPADLVRGRPLGPADGVHAAEGVFRYRTDKVKALNEELAGP